MASPLRGEVWLVDLDPVRGHEQAGKRPALVISVDAFNTGPAGLVIVLPMTSKDKGIPLHVKVDPPEGGVKATSFVKCEDIRSVSTEKLVAKLGRVSAEAMILVEDRVRILVGL
ncbi:PemK-like protein [Thermacetogenium phaeum DSM 12270]|jgi:mRNA interferase MazF|uniref:mRNA interferase n=1 Tax=Thermacetogenium phaeum (strain ATCC BAA-254 / DSM 26808 / PB) TaxID=1089553 RepID=K4LX95_THEPS|nr:type II toxin-antitoxin system PemK/MazF family toxin [Thermacetogenium phaeum]AFV12599.1 PemK-like protein [Thermacetogenium phaeum DSM 12270]